MDGRRSTDGARPAECAAIDGHEGAAGGHRAGHQQRAAVDGRLTVVADRLASERQRAGAFLDDAACTGVVGDISADERIAAAGDGRRCAGQVGVRCNRKQVCRVVDPRLAELDLERAGGDGQVYASLESNEDWDHINILLTESISAQTRPARLMRTMLSPTTWKC